MADILLTINSTAAPIKMGDVGIRLPGPQGKPGTPGQDGGDGVSIEYRWNGAELGIKREDEVNYQYTNLQGPKGDKGYTPVRGTDYWTAADQASIVADVLAAVDESILGGAS